LVAATQTTDAAAESAALEQLDTAFARMHRASRTQPAPTYEQRRGRLRRLLEAVRDRQEEIADAISRDFGGRSRHESKLADVFPVVSAIKHDLDHLGEWMQPEPRDTAIWFKPATARVLYQPLGVVGVLSPWNYPFQLAVGPLAAALGAGNRVLLKPSELTPETGALLERLLGELFPDDTVAVVRGGPAVGEAFCRKPFDHLFFTGSTRVGRLVMRAASEHLTPVTLELGGKSPAIIHPDYDLERAADRIAVGKLFNAGQTCISPDYVLVDRGRAAAFVEVFRHAVARRFPRLLENPDYTAIISAHHRQRLVELVADATGKGAEAHVINPAGEDFTGSNKLVPTVLTGVRAGMAVMEEEIFGPILPVVAVADVDEAVRFVNEQPRALALYYFDRDKRRASDLLDRTVSGGACINETLVHEAVDSLPFGGVGQSGMGRYHGREGFLTFSNIKGVFHQSALNAVGLFSPPYGPGVERLIRLVIGG
jgi:acyl-CoA reductase-like NAD-dependent aldehyde dehydrogenase